MRLFISSIVFALLIASQTALCLPDDIIDLVLKQKPQFETVLTTLNKNQSQLVLERYVDLLLKSYYTFKMDINKDELREFVFSQFFQLAKDQESPQKKGKRAPVFSQAIENELAKLTDNLQGQFKDKVLNLAFTCHGRPYIFPFVTEELDQGYSMQIRGIPVPQSKGIVSDSRCLEIQIDPNSERTDLTWIGTQETACPIPASQSGDCLLSVAETISKTVGKRQIGLLDASDIQCPLNRQRTSLQRLKIYQQGQSWYEKKGYEPVNEPAAYKARLLEFQAYLLTTLQKNFTQITPDKQTARLRRIFDEKSEEFLRLNKGKTVFEFMAWLWDTDCSVYVDIDTLITSLTSPLEFANRFPLAAVFRKQL